MKKLFSKSILALLVATVIFSNTAFAQSKSKPKIGDEGPGGGTVFYVYGTTAYECSEVLGKSNWDNAERMCKNYKGGGKSDWYLPPKDLLNNIYENLAERGLITSNTWYWASSTDSGGSPWVQNFSDGESFYTIDKDLELSVVAVRKYDYASANDDIRPRRADESSSLYDDYTDNYSSRDLPKIGDKGPGGGTIFLIEGNTAYECSDSLGNFAWLIANNVCRKFKGGGKTDWQLPTKEQLNYIYTNLQKTGKLNDDTCHWSSSYEKETNPVEIFGCAQYFSDGKQQRLVSSFDITTRAVRSFDVADFRKNGYGPTISFKEACAYLFVYEGATDFYKKGWTPEIGDIGPGGGIVFYVNNGRAYECSDFIDNCNWDEAKEACKNFRGGGKSDWYLPSREELKYIYKNVRESDLVLPALFPYYWSSEQDRDKTLAYAQYILTGEQGTNYKYMGNYVRAVRSFEY